MILLQNATVVTKHDKRLLHMSAFLLQNASVQGLFNSYSLSISEILKFLEFCIRYKNLCFQKYFSI